MEQKINRAELAKMLMKSSLEDNEKQKLLFALPKMGDEAVSNLYQELEVIKKKGYEQVHEEIEQKMAKEEQFASLSKSMGLEEEVDEDDVQEITQELLNDVGSDPEKMNAFLLALGPQGLKKLEQAIREMAADPAKDIDKAEAEEAISNLRDFTAEVYLAGQEIEEQFEKESLKEQIRAEDEKISMLQDMIEDLDQLPNLATETE